MSGNSRTPTTSASDGGNQAVASRRAILGAAAMLPVAAVPAAAGQNPDAELIRVCAEHRRTWLAFNAEGVDSDESSIWLLYLAAVEAIDHARPQTLAGVRAKAAAAKLEARRPDGTERFNEGFPAQWAADVVNDLLRLAGTASAS